MRALGCCLLLLIALAGCAAPPPSAYVQDSNVKTVPIGSNSVGEACRRLDLGGGAADIYCGEWERPSARIRPGDAASVSGADLARLADGDGPAAAWRRDIDARFTCQEPQAPGSAGAARVAVMQCRYRNSGFPQFAMVAAVGGKLWYADTTAAAFDVTERSIGLPVAENGTAALPSATLDGTRGNIGVLASVGGTGVGGDADPQLAARLAASSLKTDGAQAYALLMRQAADANRQGNSSAAEKLYRAVIALQEKLLRPDDPALATPVMSLGLQLSNQGRFAEAESSFARAQTLIGGDGGDPTYPPAGNDQTARARLYQYRAVHLLNQGHAEAALGLLAGAEAGYRALAGDALDRAAGTIMLSSTPVEALVGVIDVKRDRAWALRQLGRLPDSDAEAAAAATLARTRLPNTGSHWRERETAFVFRTHGLTAAQQGQSASAISLFEDADHDFTLVYGGTRPQAETKLRTAAELIDEHRPLEALGFCRAAIAILRLHKDGVDAELMAPCLDAYAAAATGADAQADLSEMFEAAQQVRSSQTNQQIQQAARRMSESTRDPKAAELIRRRDEADKKLDALERERLLAGQATPPPDAADLAKRDQAIEAAKKDAAALEDALQAASPSYNQLVPKVVAARDVIAALRPGEAFLQTVLSQHGGWSFLLRDGRIAIGPIAGGRERVAALVQRIRKTLEPDDSGAVLHFDVRASYELYQLVLGPIAAGLHGATTLTVAPTGPLLSLPFEVLLTAPTKPRDYANAPWLVRQLAIAHVPEPGNFLALRKLAGTSRAQKPWFGFGVADNVTEAQALASFPAADCRDTAAQLAGLPRLTAFTDQLDKSAAILRAGRADELTGAAFTADAVMKLPLKQYRVLQFAAHGLLPNDLACETEPAIVTSAPAGAADASGALLTGSRIEQLDLDAELVILSACNSGGGNGKLAGESLSGLARSFFAANARALLVSHWALFVDPASVIIPDALGRMQTQPQDGIAGALRQAQLAWLASHSEEADLHPAVWGALAVFGDGGGAAIAPASAAAQPAAPKPAAGAVSFPG